MVRLLSTLRRKFSPMQAPQKRVPMREWDSKVSNHHSKIAQPTKSVPGSHGGMRTAKEDKRRIKHASLISRIEKANAKPKKRRHPSKKLVTNLESLAEALPEVPQEDQDAVMVGGARLNFKSHRSKPGVMKRKQKSENMEREIFNRNVVQMINLGRHDDLDNGATNGMDVTPEHTFGASVDRFAALRTAIQASMGSAVERRVM